MSDRFTQLLAGKVKPGMYRLVSHVGTKHLSDNAEAAGWRCYSIDGADVKDKAGFLRAVAAALGFPAYFGHNWDALEECLRDLSWAHPAKGLLIVYSDIDRFAKAQPAEWKIAHDVLVSAISTWRKTSSPLVILLRGESTTTAQVLEL